jgi:RNA polymerase sigma-70 factor, ECF subfamily
LATVMTEKPMPRNYVEDTADHGVILMQKFQQGDQNAFDILLGIYYPQVFRFIFRIVQSREMAEDLSQETFLRVFHSAKSYQPKAKFQTWLYTIAKNLALNEIRRRKQTAFSLDEDWESKDGKVQKQIADKTAVNPGAEIVNQERADLIRAAINGLPEHQRVAVLLKRYENFSYEEIAQTLKCSVSAVKSLLSRAKENLKESLSDLLD